MNENEIQSESEAILGKIEGIDLPHVKIEERPFAVRRAIQQLGITSRDRVEVLVEVIDTNDAQIDVHGKASD
ncbi:MAG: hypothetical protein KBA40_03085 [Candidatus Peribacteraceae bacterium]|nr:hypothetical protein [Candidatus Peribacteraceae bacterium]MBP9850520.1 hypothetical protein [Candidatus Peribacteraceae bacterium]